jgi:hypothetical protein
MAKGTRRPGQGEGIAEQNVMRGLRGLGPVRALPETGKVRMPAKPMPAVAKPKKRGR